MANNEKKESLQWLKALMGKPDPKADTNLNIQAKIFRQEMLKDRKREEESKPIADERLYQNIKSNLQNQGLLSKSKKGLVESFIERKKEALKLFITALIALLVGAMIPIQIATRGENNSIFNKFKSYLSSDQKDEVTVTIISLEKENPETEANLITKYAIDEGLTVTRFHSKKNEIITQVLIIKGFNIAGYHALTRSKIGVDNRISGSVRVEISKPIKHK